MNPFWPITCPIVPLCPWARQWAARPRHGPSLGPSLSQAAAGTEENRLSGAFQTARGAGGVAEGPSEEIPGPCPPPTHPLGTVPRFSPTVPVWSKAVLMGLFMQYQGAGGAGKGREGDFQWAPLPRRYRRLRPSPPRRARPSGRGRGLPVFSEPCDLTDLKEGLVEGIVVQMAETELTTKDGAHKTVRNEPAVSSWQAP